MGRQAGQSYPRSAHPRHSRDPSATKLDVTPLPGKVRPHLSDSCRRGTVGMPLRLTALPTMTAESSPASNVTANPVTRGQWPARIARFQRNSYTGRGQNYVALTWPSLRASASEINNSNARLPRGPDSSTRRFLRRAVIGLWTRAAPSPRRSRMVDAAASIWFRSRNPGEHGRGLLFSQKRRRKTR